MIDTTHLKAHCTAACLLKKRVFPQYIGRTKGGLTSRLHAVCDCEGRPSSLFLTAGQVSDYTGAARKSCLYGLYHPVDRQHDRRIACGHDRFALPHDADLFCLERISHAPI